MLTHPVIVRWLTALLIVIGTSACAERSPYQATSPTRFNAAISEFERRDESRTTDSDAILFVGSSSIRLWAPNIERDMAPLPVIARGFGGSNMNDVNFFFDRLITPHAPSAIVVYVGENDVVQGVSSAQLLQAFETFVGKVRGTLPDTNIYYLSIKPAPARRNAWSKMQAANTVIANYANSQGDIFFIDIATPMLDSNGGAREDLHVTDGIHMNRQGYAIWTRVLKPVLLTNETSS